MIDLFKDLSPVIQALIATIFTWGVTALGAAIVFFFRKVNKTLMDALLGFAAGVMISASFFSLISPAIEMAENLNMTSYIVVSLGFIFGGILLFIGDKIYDRLDKKRKKEKKTNSKVKRCLMLISSITLHNIPEDCSCYVSHKNIILV